MEPNALESFSLSVNFENIFLKFMARIGYFQERCKRET